MFFGASLCFAIAFAVVHLLSKHMSFLRQMPRSKLLSFAGGIAVSYVFVHLLPELNHYQESIHKSKFVKIISFFENHMYVFAMIGLAIFYCLERMGQDVRSNNTDSSNETQTPKKVFWVHMLGFFMYNFLIGYLLIREETKAMKEMVLYFIALSVHFISNDHGLRHLHKTLYDRYGRWLLSLAVLAGWGVGAITRISEMFIAILFALLAGSMVLNVLKEELPEERESNIGAFLIGVVLYTILLAFIEG